MEKVPDEDAVVREGQTLSSAEGSPKSLLSTILRMLKRKLPKAGAIPSRKEWAEQSLQLTEVGTVRIPTSQ